LQFLVVVVVSLHRNLYSCFKNQFVTISFNLQFSFLLLLLFIAIFLRVLRINSRRFLSICSFLVVVALDLNLSSCSSNQRFPSICSLLLLLLCIAISLSSCSSNQFAKTINSFHLVHRYSHDLFPSLQSLDKKFR
jgi:uncharacterized membrane protein YhaH (DUF805 family)